MYKVILIHVVQSYVARLVASGGPTRRAAESLFFFSADAHCTYTVTNALIGISALTKVDQVVNSVKENQSIDWSLVSVSLLLSSVPMTVMSLTNIACP